MTCPTAFRSSELGPKRTIALPDVHEGGSGSGLTIVAVTGNELRHERFARRIAQSFPGAHCVWYRLSAVRKSERLGRFAAADRLFGPNGGLSRYRKEYGLLRTLQRGLAARGILLSALRSVRHLFAFHREVVRAERKLFSGEIEGLRKTVELQVREVQAPLTPEFIQEVRRLKPYFLAACGGPLYPPELIECARGAALNQHAGWAPTFRGSHTITWALYHRDLARVATTVHLLTPSVDAGPVVRYGWVALTGNETVGECFVRAVALGTELLIEVMQEALRDGVLEVYDQVPRAGGSFIAAECTGEVFAAVKRDLRRGWLAYELRRLASF